MKMFDQHNVVLRSALRAACAVAWLSVACQGAKVAPADGLGPSNPERAGRGGSGGVALPPADAAAFDLGGGTQAPPSAVPDGGACAEETRAAMQVPVDVLLVIDASSSMGAMVEGGASKYAQVRQALEGFVAAPGSAGLGLGLAFFPQPGGGWSCQTDVDCGYLNSPMEPPCQTVSICANTISAANPTFCGGSRNRPCPAGDTCVPLGRCTASLADCTNLGQPCPGGVPSDMCSAVGKACEVTDNQLCEPAAYEALSVPIVQLPDPGTRLIRRAFQLRGPTGGTPLRPAYEGAAAALRKHLMTRPDHKGVIVLATDGAPFGCQMNAVADVSRSIAAARADKLDTYVIGVATPNDGAERMQLTDFAVAGGTTTPFVISPSEPLAQKFLDTLNQIRGKALPCEFTIPKSSGGAIDFAKVNVDVRWVAGGTQEEILYAGSAAKCDPQKGGWYYDVDPAMGTPSRIIVCEASCRKLKAQNDATVDLRFGCATRTID